MRRTEEPEIGRPAQNESDKPKLGRKGLMGGGAVLIVAAVLVIALIAQQSTSNSGSPASTAVAASPLDSCRVNLSNWVIYGRNYPNPEFDAAFTTFGAQSPINQWIGQEQGPFDTQVASSGQGSADTALAQVTQTECVTLKADGFTIGEIPPPPASPSDPAPIFNGAPGSGGSS